MTTTPDGPMADEQIWVGLGSGGHALSVFEAAGFEPRWRCVGLLAPNKNDCAAGLPVKIIGTDDELGRMALLGVHHATVLVGSSGSCHLRAAVAERVRAAGLALHTILHPSAAISSTASIGAGSVVLAGAVVGPGAVLGENVIVNCGAIVEHESVIGDHSHVASGAVVCGRAFIGMRTHIGARSVVLQGLTVGDDVIVGAGATVLNDVKNGLTVVGTPARHLGGDRR